MGLIERIGRLLQCRRSVRGSVTVWRCQRRILHRGACNGWCLPWWEI